MRSGEVLDWSDAGLPGPALDKHSTGGVGDKVSLLLAPDGRRLRRRGADDLRPRPRPHRRDARQARVDPGLRHDPGPRRACAPRSRNAGCAIIGQTGDLAPADRRLYAIRDATAHRRVAARSSSPRSCPRSSPPASTRSSWTSRRGSGAFMTERRRTRASSRGRSSTSRRGNGLACPRAAHRHGPRARAHRRQRARGPRGDRPPHRRGERPAPRRGHRRAVPRAARASAASTADDPARGAARAGAAAERFAAMVAELGGPADLLEDPDAPPARRAARSPPPCRTAPGSSRSVDVRAVGLAVVALGGGRRREAESVDHAVGLSEVAAPGERVGPAGAPLAVVHARTRGRRRRGDRGAAGRVHGRRRGAGRPARDRRARAPREPPWRCPQGRAPRPPRGHRARPTSSAGSPSATGWSVPEGVFDEHDRFAWRDFLHFLQTYDLRGERHPHGRGLPRRHLRVPRRPAPRRARSTSS